MSTTDEHIQSSSEVFHVKDPMQMEGSLKESETCLFSSADDPVASKDSNLQGMLSQNGSQTPSNNTASVVSTPPRSDPPDLRKVLTPPNIVKPALIVHSELQASTNLASEASIIPGAGEMSKTEVGDASVKIPLAEVVEASVPGIIPSPEAEGSNVTEGILGPKEVKVSVLEIIPAPEAREGNIPVSIPPVDGTGSNASTGVPAAEAFGGNLPEAVSAIETKSYVPEIEIDAAGSNVLENVSSKEVVGDNDSRADSVADSQVSDVYVDLPEAEAKKADIPEFVPNAIVNVPEAIQSTVNIVPAGVLPTKFKWKENIPPTKDSVLEEPIKKDVKVHEPAQSSEDISFTKVDHHAKSEVDKAPKEGNVSEMAIDSSVAKNLVSEIENAEKSDPPSQPTEKTMETSESSRSAGKGSESLHISDFKEIAEKSLEPKSAACQTFEPVQKATEISELQKNATTATEESSQASELDKEAAQTPKRNPPATEEFNQGSGKSMDTSDDPKNSSTTAEEFGLTSELAKEDEHTSEPQPAADECSQALETTKQVKERDTTCSDSARTSKPVEEIKETTKPQKYVATTDKSTQVPEPKGEAMEISEPASSSSGSGQTSEPNEEAKREPGKIDSKEAERSPIKRLAKGRLEDLKSDEPQTPKSPSRRSSRLQALQRTHSESPSPKKERRTVRSITLERVPSDDKMGLRTRGRRVGSTSSNSEMEGSGDEVKTKRVSRKDSKK